MKTNSNTNLVYAISLMLTAIAAFTSMAVSGRYASVQLDTFEIMFYRSLIGFLLVLSFAATTSRLRQISFLNLKLHAVRNLFHFTAQNLWFFAITVIPLVQVFALEFTVPIWVLLLSPLFLGEPFTKSRALAAVFGFAGILIITRPAPDTLNIGILAAAVAAIGFAGSMMTTKKLTQKADTLTILFFMTMMQLIFGLICAGIDGDISSISKINIHWVFAIALAGLLGHLCLTRALALAPATLVAPIDFLRLPVIAIVGFYVFGETVDQYMAYGVILIFAGNYANIIAEKRKRADAPKLH
jgi:drug/metabolite transporter (DMT)-like permease